MERASNVSRKLPTGYKNQTEGLAGMRRRSTVRNTAFKITEFLTVRTTPPHPQTNMTRGGPQSKSTRKMNHPHTSTPNSKKTTDQVEFRNPWYGKRESPVSVIDGPGSGLATTVRTQATSDVQVQLRNLNSSLESANKLSLGEFKPFNPDNQEAGYFELITKDGNVNKNYQIVNISNGGNDKWTIMEKLGKATGRKAKFITLDKKFVIKTADREGYERDNAKQLKKLIQSRCFDSRLKTVLPDEAQDRNIEGSALIVMRNIYKDISDDMREKMSEYDVKITYTQFDPDIFYKTMKMPKGFDRVGMNRQSRIAARPGHPGVQVNQTTDTRVDKIRTAPLQAETRLKLGARGLAEQAIKEYKMTEEYQTSVGNKDDEALKQDDEALKRKIQLGLKECWENLADLIEGEDEKKNSFLPIGLSFSTEIKIDTFDEVNVSFTLLDTPYIVFDEDVEKTDALKIHTQNDMTYKSTFQNRKDALVEKFKENAKRAATIFES